MQRNLQWINLYQVLLDFRTIKKVFSIKEAASISKVVRNCRNDISICNLFCWKKKNSLDENTRSNVIYQLQNAFEILSLSLLFVGFCLIYALMFLLMIFELCYIMIFSVITVFPLELICNFYLSLWGKQFYAVSSQYSHVEWHYSPIYSLQT